MATIVGIYVPAARRRLGEFSDSEKSLQSDHDEEYEDGDEENSSLHRRRSSGKGGRITEYALRVGMALFLLFVLAVIGASKASRIGGSSGGDGVMERRRASLLHRIVRRYPAELRLKEEQGGGNLSSIRMNAVGPSTMQRSVSPVNNFNPSVRFFSSGVTDRNVIVQSLEEQD